LFDGENISFDAGLVVYINGTNIPSSMVINRIYELQNLLLLLPVSFLVRLRTYQHPCIACKHRLDSLGGTRDFLLPASARTGFEVHQTSCSVGSGGFFSFLGS